jgi:hypothetical protein
MLNVLKVQFNLNESIVRSSDREAITMGLHKGDLYEYIPYQST